MPTITMTPKLSAALLALRAAEAKLQATPMPIGQIRGAKKKLAESELIHAYDDFHRAAERVAKVVRALL